MAKVLFIFTALTFSSWRLADESRGVWLVWNVGQGQWLTYIEGKHCLHFDIGGERASWLRISRWCKRRENSIFISHWDWDHISFASRSRSALPGACIWAPSKEGISERKTRVLGQLQPCHEMPKFQVWVPAFSQSSNDSSRVAFWQGMLIPGDSSKAQEKYWSRQMSGLSKARWLLVGHHGSRTSTSRLLLDQLPHLKQAVISARQSRYGHPHAEVIRDLRFYKVPTLRTEDWGDIAIW